MTSTKPQSYARSILLHGTAYLTTTRLKELERPSYCPVLAPNDFALFPHLKMKIEVRRFSNYCLSVGLRQ